MSRNRSRRIVKKLLRRARRSPFWNADWVMTPDRRIVTMQQALEMDLVQDYALAVMR